jgi:SNF2 family DNA or RNA helicase
MNLLPLWENFEYLPHQVEGIKWMLGNEREGNYIKEFDKTVYGGLQCDDMGLGKTIQMLSVIVNNPKPRTLLVLPIAMIKTWTDLVMKMGFSVHTMTIENEKGSWMRTFKGNMDYKVYITNYHKLNVIQSEWDRVILDEGHQIRNYESDISYMARNLKGKYYWVLTGTPLINGYDDVASLFAFLQLPVTVWKASYMKIVKKILIHRSVRTLKMNMNYPTHTLKYYNLPFTTVEEEENYNNIQTTQLEDNSNICEVMLRLRQLSVHPKLYMGEWNGSSTKIDALMSIVRENGETDKYIIFCQFLNEMNLIKDYLIDSYIVNETDIGLYNGGMSMDERNNVLDMSPKILLMQLNAGGVGLNLQEYNNMIFMSPYWTYALTQQAIARSVRLGQKRNVVVHHLNLCAEHNVLSKNINIDASIRKKAKEKEEMLKELFSL